MFSQEFKHKPRDGADRDLRPYIYQKKKMCVTSKFFDMQETTL